MLWRIWLNWVESFFLHFHRVFPLSLRDENFGETESKNLIFFLSVLTFCTNINWVKGHSAAGWKNEWNRCTCSLFRSILGSLKITLFNFCITIWLEHTQKIRIQWTFSIQTSVFREHFMFPRCCYFCHAQFTVLFVLLFPLMLLWWWFELNTSKAKISKGLRRTIFFLSLSLKFDWNEILYISLRAYISRCHKF